MNLVVRPSSLSGRITAPPSKSHMQRLVAAALLANGESWIRNPSDAADGWAALSAAAGLGADAEVGSDAIRIQGGLNPRSRALNMGESGLGIRMFAPIAALTQVPLTLEAEGTLTQRPMHPLADALNAAGVKVELNSGRPPIHIQGSALDRGPFDAFVPLPSELHFHIDIVISRRWVVWLFYSLMVHGTYV